MIPKLYIGIDPGSKTGIACYSLSKGLNIYTKSFWGTIDFLGKYALMPMNKGEIDPYVVIEASQKNKFIYGRHEAIVNQQAIARRVGMNHRDGQLLEEWMTFNKIKFEQYVPNGVVKKWDAKYFKMLSGIDTLKTHEHSRDAARFIARFWVNNIKVTPSPLTPNLHNNLVNK